MQNLNQLKKYILSLIDDSWTKLEKTRFVYVMSGRYLQKYTEFFLTLEDKLSDSALSPSKLDKVIKNRKNKYDWNKMICKTGAIFIKEILDELNINSQLVETVRYEKRKGMRSHIHHYFLCVNISNRENIFLTPAADYGNIQNNLCTLRFGSEISYLLDGNPYYKSNIGEIPHRVLTRKEVKELDDKLGLSMKVVDDNNREYTTYYDEILKKNKNLYIDSLSMETSFYNNVMPKNEEDREIVKLSDPDNDWDMLLTKICTYVGERISIFTGFDYDFGMYINKDTFENWCNYIETMFFNKNYEDNRLYYSNPNLLYHKAKKLCELIINFVEEEKNKNNLKDDYIMFRSKFNRGLLDVSKHFILSSYVVEPYQKDDYISNVYINNKIKYFFPYFFNSNSGFIEDFNKEGYSEQIEFIKRTIELMFSELREKNILKEPDPDFKLNPIFKRVNLYSVKNKHKEEYAVYMAITDSDQNNPSPSYWYKFDLKENIFHRTSPSRMAIECSKNGKYEVISDRLKSLFEDLEDSGNSLTLKKRD